MSFGTQYVPSLAAATGFLTASILKFLAKDRENQIKNVQTFQNSQLSATQCFAAAEQDTIFKDAASIDDQADATRFQGAFTLAAPIASTVYEGYRSSETVQTGLSKLSTNLGMGQTELGSILEEGQNVQSWKQVLKNGNQPVMSAADEHGVPMDVFNDNSPEEVKATELDYLRHKNDFAKTNPNDASQATDADNLASIKPLKGGAKEDDPDVIQRKRLYKDVSDKLDEEEQSVQKKRSRYDEDTYRKDQKITTAVQAIGQVIAAKKQADQADDTRLKGEAQAAQEFASYNQKSQEQAVQTSMKVYDDMNQAQQQASQAYFQGLASANQPV